MTLPRHPDGRLVVPEGKAAPRPRRAARPKGMTPRDLQAWAMGERELQDWVLATIATPPLRGRIWHFHDSRSELNRAGFPDLVLMSHHGTWLRELKREGESLTVEQLYFLAQADENGLDAAVWYPRHRTSGYLGEALPWLAFGAAGRAAA
jgi:hypothetical protein